MLIKTAHIVKKANELVAKYHSKDPYTIAKKLGIEILERDFVNQLGVYQPILGIPFIFIKADLDPVTLTTVLWHEIGHHILHRKEAENGSVFLESDLFNGKNRFEYEANIFAAQALLPDDEFLELAKDGFNGQQIADALLVDINLVSLKVDILIQKGYKLNKQTFNKNFLRTRKP